MKNVLGQLSEEDKIALRQQLHPYMQAALAHQLDAVVGTFAFRIGSEVKHLETGGIYLITGLPNENTMKVADGWAPCYTYLMVDGRTAYRTQAQMEDGRFEEVPAGSALEYAKQIEANGGVKTQEAPSTDKPITKKFSMADLAAALPTACSKIYTDYEKGYNKALMHV